MEVQRPLKKLKEYNNMPSSFSASWGTSFPRHHEETPRGRGWTDRPVQTPSISISGCNSAKSGGLASISPHNPQRFHDWNWAENLVWAGHGPCPKVVYLLYASFQGRVSLNASKGPKPANLQGQLGLSPGQQRPAKFLNHNCWRS